MKGYVRPVSKATVFSEDTPAGQALFASAAKMKALKLLISQVRLHADAFIAQTGGILCVQRLASVKHIFVCACT